MSSARLWGCIISKAVPCGSVSSHHRPPPVAVAQIVGPIHRERAFSDTALDVANKRLTSIHDLTTLCVMRTCVMRTVNLGPLND